MKIDGQLFGQAEVSLKNAVDILNGNKVSAIKLYPSDYEYVSDVENVCTIISEIVIGLVSLGEQMTSAKQSAMNLDSSFQVNYFKFMSSSLATSDFSITSNITNDDYDEHLLNYLGANLNSLSQEELQLYNELKFISESKEKLNNLYNQKENNNGLLHPIKEKEINDQIAEIEKNLGIYENKWYEDIGQAIVQTGAEWKQGFTSLANGEGFGEILDATKKTVATGTVTYRSFKSGVQKLGEKLVVDSIATGVSGVQKIFGFDEAADKTMDFVRMDLVGEKNKNFYENTELGKWINNNSTLKYDSAGAKIIQDSTEFVAKIGLATAATILSGGAAAPLTLGALYGIGQAGENYAQSVDREHGESYNYLEAFGRAAAGGVAGAAEFYGYGQMGAGMLGVNISPQASTSFAKNFFTKDVLLDSASVVVDHGVSVAFGDETWQQALKSGGLEFAFALEMNAVGARQATKAARATQSMDDVVDVFRRTDMDVNDMNNYLSTLSDQEKSLFWEQLYSDYDHVSGYDINIKNIDNLNVDSRVQISAGEKKLYVKEKIVEDLNGQIPGIESLSDIELQQRFPDLYLEKTKQLYIDRVVAHNSNWTQDSLIAADAAKAYDFENFDEAFSLLDSKSQEQIIKNYKKSLSSSQFDSFKENAELIESMKAKRVLDEIENSFNLGVYEENISYADAINLLEDSRPQEFYHSASSKAAFDASLGATNPNDTVKVYVFQDANGNGSVKFGGAIGRPDEGAFVMTADAYRTHINNRNIFDENGKLINKTELGKVMGGVEFSDDVYTLEIELPRSEVEMARGSYKGAFKGDWTNNAKNPGGYEGFIKPTNVFDNNNINIISNSSNLNEEQIYDKMINNMR